MSYVNLLNITCSDKNELFCRMRDYLCKRNGTYDYSSIGIGWTLFDESYATDEDNVAINDWYVIYSPGENGKEDLYFKVTWINGYIKVNGFQSWDSSTHAGPTTNKYGTTNNFTLHDSTGNYILWVYGDLDFVCCLNDLIATNTYGVGFGKLVKGYDDLSDTIATCATTLTAGSDVSIVVDSVPSNWAVDKEVFIRTTHNDAMATVEIEKITIKTLVSNTITADLSNDYTADSCLSDHVGYYCQNSNRFVGAGNMLISPSGSIAWAILAGIWMALPTASFDPEDYEERYSLTDYIMQSTKGLSGKFPFVKRVPGFTAGYVRGDVLEEEDGTEWRTFSAYSNVYTGIKEI